MKSDTVFENIVINIFLDFILALIKTKKLEKKIDNLKKEIKEFKEGKYGK